MKRTILYVLLIAAFLVTALDASAKGRTGSKRVGGYTSSGKGSHYVGGRK